MAQTFEQLKAGAEKIKLNELPESNTHGLVGEQLLQMATRMEDDDKTHKESLTKLETETNGKLSELEKTSTTTKQVVDILANESMLLQFCVTACCDKSQEGTDISLEHNVFTDNAVLDNDGNIKSQEYYKTSKYFDGLGQYGNYSALTFTAPPVAYSYPSVCYYKTDTRAFVMGFKVCGEVTILIPAGYSVRFVQNKKTAPLIYNIDSKITYRDLHAGSVQISNLSPQLSNIFNSITEGNVSAVKAEAVSTIAESAINWDGNVKNNPEDKNMTIYVYDLKSLDTIRLKGTITAFNRLAWAFYDDIAISKSSLVLAGDNVKNADGNNPTRYDIVLEKPSAAKYIAISSYRNNEPLFIYTDVFLSPNARYPICVKNEGDDIKVLYKYSSTEDIRITIGRCGVNRLYQIKNQEFIENTSGMLSDINTPATSSILSNSDWVGPYMIIADGIPKGETTTFTGGWHGTNGDQTGNPTAESSYVKVSIDHTACDIGSTIAGDCAEIITQNLLCASNTKDTGQRVLKETVKYTFSNHKIYVNVTIEALADMAVLLYYGMQISGYNQKYTFISESKMYEAANKQSLSVEEYVTDIIGVDNNGRSVIASIDYKGLGCGKYHGTNNKRYALSESYGKAYYQLIKGTYEPSHSYDDEPLRLKTGEKTMWSGIYNFEHV